MSVPPLPENLRLARLSDLPRIAIVCTAGFFNSPVFHYIRPGYKDYLQDTVASYRASSKKEILDPDAVVVVAENTFREDESEFVFDQLKNAYPPLHERVPTYSSETNKVIVGVATLSLKAVPKLSGQFLPDGIQPEGCCYDPEDLGRDKCFEAFKRFVETQEKAREKWFDGHMEVTSMAVHPAYWREGVGKKMTTWFIALADGYKRPMCISAAPMGVKLASHLGFQEGTIVSIAGYKEHPNAIRLWFGLRPNAEQVLRLHITASLCHQAMEPSSMFGGAKEFALQIQEMGTLLV